MALNYSTGVDVTNSTFSEVHHGGTQINGPQINYFNDTASRFEIFCQRRVAGAAFNSSERHPAPKCLPNTRVGVRMTIGQWCGPGGAHDRPICWLRGPAGSGKSAIAQTIAEECDQNGDLAGSFFFSRGSPCRSDITGFVPTIAYQLAISVPSIKDSMEGALHLDPSIPDQTCQHQFKKLIINPLLTLRDPVSPKVIVLDALDECDGEGLIEGLIMLLAEAYKKDRLPLRFFLTSRTDVYIRELHESSEVRSRIFFMALEEFDARDDIRAFFETRFSTIYSRNYWGMRDVPALPSRSDLDRLVAKSSGLFILASTIVKFVNDGSDLPHLRLQTALEINWSDGDQRAAASTSPQELQSPDDKLSVDHLELVRKMSGAPTLRSPPQPEAIIRDHAPLDTGRYTITNVRFKNLAVLPDSNHESQIVARARHDNSGEIWDITLSSNGRYTVRSHDHSNFASCSTSAKKGDSICGRARNQQWIIKETRVGGRFTLSLTDSQLFWGFIDGEIDTPLTLGSVPNDPKNQWFFTKVSG